MTNPKPDPIPAKEDLPTTEKLKSARIKYARRVEERLAANWDAQDPEPHVDVTYRPPEDTLERLRDLQDQARYQDRHALIVKNHGDPTRTRTCLALLTSLEAVPRTQDVTGFLGTWLVRQDQTRNAPPKPYQQTQDTAHDRDRLPLHVAAKHGTKQGVARFPLGLIHAPALVTRR